MNVGGVLLTVALLIAACGSSGTKSPAATAKRTSIVFAYNPNVGYLSLMVAASKGYFAKHNLDVTLQNVPTPATVPAALVQGQFQLAGTQAPGLIDAQLQHIDVVGVAGQEIDTKEAPTFALLATKSITKPADLVGKRIGFPALQGSIYAATVVWLQKQGVPLSSYQPVAVPFPNMAQQLAAGAVDAATMTPPFSTPLLKSNQYTNFGDPQLLEIGSPVLTAFTMANRQWAMANKGPIAEWIASLNQAIAFIKAHPDQARRILQSYTQETAAAVAATPIPIFSATVTSKQIAQWIPVLKASGLVSGSVPTSGLTS